MTAMDVRIGRSREVPRIARFERNTALLAIDAQNGVNMHDFWGGSCGHRNNPDAEARVANLLAAWRAAGLPVYFTFHDSRKAASPLKLSLESGRPMAGLEPLPGERVIVKDVNSGFIGNRTRTQPPARRNFPIGRRRVLHQHVRRHDRACRR